MKAARKAKHLTRKVLAEIVGIEWRYLANIENKGTIPSLPVVIQLIKVCGLPVEQYFNPEIIRGDSEQRQRVSHKLKLCPEHYLPVIEGALDGALKIEQSAKETGDVLKHPPFSVLPEGRKALLFFLCCLRKSLVLRVVGRVGSVLFAEKKKRSKHRKCSNTSENRPAPVPAGRGRLLVGESPKPLFRKDGE